MALFGIDIKDVTGAVGAIGSVAKDVRAAITGTAVVDPAAQAQLQAKMADIDAAILNAQAAINQAEAGNKSLFVSGWRPFLGWIGGLAFGVQFLIRPIAGAFGLSVPALDMDALWPMLAGILGLGTLRTVEKVNGAAAK